MAEKASLHHVIKNAIPFCLQENSFFSIFSLQIITVQVHKPSITLPLETWHWKSQTLPVWIGWKKSNASRGAKPAPIDFDRNHYCNNNISNRSSSLCLSLQLTNFPEVTWQHMRVSSSLTILNLLFICSQTLHQINKQPMTNGQQTDCHCYEREIYIIHISDSGHLHYSDYI